MKAVILAAGKGTRMLPLTLETPKVLIPICGRPFLSYILSHLKYSGVDGIAIVVGHKKEKVEQFLQINKINAVIIEQLEQKGSGHAVIQAKKFCGDEDFIVLSGDTLLSGYDFKSIMREDSFSYIFGRRVEDPSKYGVLNVEGDFLRNIVEKPKDFVGDFVNAGVYKLTKDIWPALDNIKVSPRGEFEITDAIKMLAKRGKVKVLKLKDYWLDLSSLEDIKKVEEFLVNHGYNFRN